MNEQIIPINKHKTTQPWETYMSSLLSNLITQELSYLWPLQLFVAGQ